LSLNGAKFFIKRCIHTLAIPKEKKAYNNDWIGWELLNQFILYISLMDFGLTQRVKGFAEGLSLAKTQI